MSIQKLKCSLLVLLLFSFISGADQTLITSYGNLEVINTEATNQWLSQTYIFRGKVIGFSEWMDVKVQRLASIGGQEYLILIANTGGNKCQDLVAFVEVNTESIRLSRSFDICNGVYQIKLSGSKVSVLEVGGKILVHSYSLNNDLFENKLIDAAEKDCFLRAEE